MPTETLGQSMLGYLALKDIVRFENAAASHESQQLLRAILPYCPPIAFKSRLMYRSELNIGSIKWFNQRRCRVQFVRIDVELLIEVDSEEFFIDDIELGLNGKMSLNSLKPLQNHKLTQRITRVVIREYQEPAVLEVLFSLLTSASSSSVRSLDVDLSNLSEWLEHIKDIGPCLHELFIHNYAAKSHNIRAIMETSSRSLDNRCLRSESDSTILQYIAVNCPHLRILRINTLYQSSTECVADLTAFAEKCPQLEELSLDCGQLTDHSVIALAQNCSRLKKLNLNQCSLTVASLIALSERGLPLEELDIPWIPIPTAEIAAQCAYALSQIRKLITNGFRAINRYIHVIQHMTGLRKLYLDCTEDHLLLPHLLLQGQCSSLEILYISKYSTITLQQLTAFASQSPQLRILTIKKQEFTDEVLVELAHSCPHLQKVTLSSAKLTMKSVLALSAHCRQLRRLDIPETTLTEETVRQLTQHCPHLTSLDCRMPEPVRFSRL